MKISIELDQSREKQLEELAAHHGHDTSEQAKRILEDYLDFQALPTDSEDDWAKTSVALAPQLLEEEDWEEGTAANGPR